MLGDPMSIPESTESYLVEVVHVEVEELRVEAGSVVAGVARRELVVQRVARPERGGGGGVVTHGDGDGLALLGRQHVELDADQLGLAVRAAAACVLRVSVSSVRRRAYKRCIISTISSIRIVI